MDTLVLNVPLTWQQVAAIAEIGIPLALGPAARDKLDAAQAVVQSTLSKNILMSHAVGIGAPLGIAETRAIHGCGGDQQFCPYQRFADALASACAWLGADVVFYSFIVTDFHHLLLAGLPARCHFAPSLSQPKLRNAARLAWGVGVRFD